MGTKKLTAVIRILTPRRNLKARMQLVLFMQEFYVALTQDLELKATEAGELHTLQALRSITEDQLEKSNKLNVGH